MPISTDESLGYPCSKEKQKMIDKAGELRDQINHLRDTKKYYYEQIGKIEVAVNQAIHEKEEYIKKILELSANIDSLEDQYVKEINFIDINLNRGTVKENDTNSE